VVKDAPQYLKVVIFSKNMLRCLVNQLTEQERFLHRMAERALKAIQTKGTSDSDFAAAAIKGLIGPYGTINFDQITKTKTVEKLLVEAGQGDMSATTDYFRSLINESKGDEKAVALKRRKLADYLVSSLRSRSSQTNSSDVAGLAAAAKDILALFVHFGFFINATPRPPFSASSQEMFRSQLVSCLNNLMGTHSELVDLPYEVITIIHQEQESDQTSSLVIELDETASESLEGAWRTLRKITKKVNSVSAILPQHSLTWS
jgi:DNA polymerase phi